MRAMNHLNRTYDRQDGIIGNLQTEIDAATDPRQAYRKVRDTIAEYRRRGKNPPDELLVLERNLALDCIEESQGR